MWRRPRFVVISLVACVTALWLPTTLLERGTASATDASITIRGSGSWGAGWEMPPWTSALYSGSGGVLNVHYTPDGTKSARQAFLDGQTDFVVSGVPFTSDELSQLPNGTSDLVDVPFQVSALSFMIALPYPDGLQSIASVPNCDPDDPPPPAFSCTERTPYAGDPRDAYKGELKLPADSLASMIVSNATNGKCSKPPDAPDPNLPLNSWSCHNVVTAFGGGLTNPVTWANMSAQAGPASVLRSDPDESSYYLQRYIKATALDEVWQPLLDGGNGAEWEPTTERLPSLSGVTRRDGAEQQAATLERPQVNPTTGSFSSSSGGILAPVPPSAFGEVAAVNTTPGTTFAEVKNGNADWVGPTPASINAAVDAGGDTPLYAENHPVADAYPLVWVDHLYVRAHGLADAKAEGIASMIRYVVTDGQSIAGGLGEGRLPASLVTAALSKTNDIVENNCTSPDSVVANEDAGGLVPSGPGTASIGTMSHCQGPNVPAGLPPIPPTNPSGAVTGSGSSFAALEIDQWRADTARPPYDLTINYNALGSSAGRQNFIDNAVDYAVSDLTFQSAEISPLTGRRCQGQLQGCFEYVPVSAAGLGFMYNLVDAAGHRVTDLHLTRASACGIFTGAINNWSDPRIVSTNPALAGVNRPIVPVIRSDGAGESYVFSEFCLAIAPDVWNAFVAERSAHDPGGVTDEFKNHQPTSNWPQGWGNSTAQAGADSTANVVADSIAGQNSITYIAAGYAGPRNMPVASIENASGAFTQPDAANVTAALAYATPLHHPGGNDDGTFTLDFAGSDPHAYFPATFSYAIAQTRGFDHAKGSALGTFLCYAVTKGQDVAAALRYAPLAPAIVDIAATTISRIPGAPTHDQCLAYADTGPPPLIPEFPTTLAAPLIAIAGGLVIVYRRRRRQVRA